MTMKLKACGRDQQPPFVGYLVLERKRTARASGSALAIDKKKKEEGRRRERREGSEPERRCKKVNGCLPHDYPHAGARLRSSCTELPHKLHISTSHTIHVHCLKNASSLLVVVPVLNELCNKHHRKSYTKGYGAFTHILSSSTVPPRTLSLTLSLSLTINSDPSHIMTTQSF